ncbi:hypothetical protein [Methylobacterium gnaphalii]|nr:hypothetical protein [Methylobacterium gnaphalii]
MSEHRLHEQVAHPAGRREGSGRLLQTTLDCRHARESRRAEAVRTGVDAQAL